VFFADNDDRNLSERLLGEIQTNNRAEIYAVIRALEEKNRYMSYNNKSIKNQDLIKRLKKLIDYRIGTVKLVHVRGHLGNYGNEQADRLAKHGSLKEAVAQISKLENNI
ncbi:20873_t:CDS:2, partial [Racocetra persica]